MAKKKKVTVVGAGNVGATCAARIVESDLADVVLVDVVDGLAAGKALDIMQSAPILGFQTTITGTTSYKETRGSDVVVITAGLARKPGMSRDDLLLKNASIVHSIVGQIAVASPQAVLIIVTNPLDVMCAVARDASGFPARQIVGMAGELDGARLSHFVRCATDVSVNDIYSVVLGTHGDAMVPLPRFSHIGKSTLAKKLSPQRVQRLLKKTKTGGAEIVGLLKTGSAYYAPSAAAFKMVHALLHKTSEVLCASAYLNGEYGVNDVFCGVPVVLGKKGVTQVVDLKLNTLELKSLQKSAETIKANVETVRQAGIIQ